jgi:hypothetical protein
MSDLACAFAAHFARERAVAAARRFISRSKVPVLRRSDAVAFLRRRRERLREDEGADIADEALRLCMKAAENRANRALAVD